MQENVPQWDSMSINHVPPWGVKLLFLYLLLACIFLLVRAAQGLVSVAIQEAYSQ
jgi:hypothetical protein